MEEIGSWTAELCFANAIEKLYWRKIEIVTMSNKTLIILCSAFIVISEVFGTKKHLKFDDFAARNTKALEQN